MNSSFIRGGLALLAALIPLACGSVSNDGPTACPSGSYTETCNEPMCSASSITASCRQQDGVTYSTSSLLLPCTQSITNCNGGLTCGVCPVLSGSYAASCTGCVANSRLLTCLSCTDEQRIGHETSLVLPCNLGVSNCNGGLVCGPATGC